MFDHRIFVAIVPIARARARERERKREEGNGFFFQREFGGGQPWPGRKTNDVLGRYDSDAATGPLPYTCSIHLYIYILVYDARPDAFAFDTI